MKWILALCCLWACIPDTTITPPSLPSTTLNGIIYQVKLDNQQWVLLASGAAFQNAEGWQIKMVC